MKQGFTLIELSIVLVIIGLIVGGVLVGQDMIKAAELRSVVSDIEEFRTSYNTFRLKYNGMPGDLKNADVFFAADCTAASIPAIHCYGNGDKQFNCTGSPSDMDCLRYWAHMSFAGMVEGNFPGILTGTITPGAEVPKSSLKGAGYLPLYFSSDSENRFQFGAEHSGGALTGAVLNQVDALAIDQKADDGVPTTGRVGAAKGSGIGGAACSPSYDATDTDIKCTLDFSVE